MKVVTNASPLVYLAKLDRLELLQHLYGTVLVPAAAYAEATAYPDIHPEVSHIRSASFLLVTRVQEREFGTGYYDQPALGPRQSRGSCSVSGSSDLVILDEARARRYAEVAGYPVTGTLGTIVRAYARGLALDAPHLVHRLALVISPKLYNGQGWVGPHVPDHFASEGLSVRGRFAQQLGCFRRHTGGPSQKPRPAGQTGAICV